MKNTSAARIMIILSIIWIFTFPLQAFCEEVNLLSFDQVEREMIIRNPDILDNNRAYGQTVEDADANNSWSIRITAQAYTTEKSNYQIVWNAQKSFISYYDLKRQLYLSEAKEAQLTYHYKLTSLKESLGRATKEDVFTAGNQLADQKKNTQTLDDNLQEATKDYNLLLGQETNTSLILESVPEVSLEVIEAINADEDYKEAARKSYEIRVAELPGNGYDDRQQETVRREFKDSFYTVYQDLQDAVDNYKYAQELSDIAQKNYEIARKKLNYGIISQIDFVDADYTWSSKRVDIQAARDDLFQAYQRYLWAKRGLIFN